MPELPETETIARELQRLLAGRVIREARVIRDDVIRGATPAELVRRSSGRAVARVWRRAKTVVLDLDSGDRLLVTPRFTGAVLVDAPDAPNVPPDRGPDGPSLSPDEPPPSGATNDYLTVEWRLEGGGRFWYRDVRRLGTVTLADARDFASFDQRLGIEPLDDLFTTPVLSGILRSSRQAVKKVLMDQRVLAGVGNIYANEALWRAGIDPSRPARSLSPSETQTLRQAIVDVLTASIAARGTTFRDYRDPSNERGAFASQLRAYGRGGETCERCGGRLVETHAIDGRSTVFCYRCQR